MRIRPYRDSDLDAVAALWRACHLVVPYNDPKQDIEFCRASGHGEVFVGEDESGQVVASAMAGHDGHRGWLYYVAVEPRLQKGGLGRALVHHAEEWLKGRGVRKVQLLVRAGNASAERFYERLGYERSPVAVLQRWLIPPGA
ncbi:MAG TPA: GNAT family acetyltransferase [Alphaproteobacteria bacterium]|nr:GNAT family acetyltransferase [Alphaproteobacteria bacterium]